MAYQRIKVDFNGLQLCPAFNTIFFKHMFIIFQSTNKEFLLRISYMEIYTEKIYDLFDDIEKTLKLQEDTVSFMNKLDEHIFHACFQWT